MADIAFYRDKSAEENVRQALERARSQDRYHAFLHFTEERALERAKKVDSGEVTGRLAGVPFVVKDNFLAFGAPTTAASKMLENFNAPLQATAVEKLEAEGAICIGKVNLDAFAHGGSTENSAFGPTKNAHDTTRVAGGSSGGSAVAVALDIVPFALGSDTGGSIRQPASFNGVYGMKPTYGAVSRYGVVAMASSTDCVGCFATTAEDTELILDIIAGQDKKDMTTYADYFTPQKEIKPLKIAVINECLNDAIDSDVRQTTVQTIKKLETLGHTVEHVSLPVIKHALAMYYIIVPAEISSNLARYDGVRYGTRTQNPSSLAELYGRTRDEGFVTENKRRILIGSYVLSSGYYDAYYQKAQKARALLMDGFEKLFASYDVLITPTVPTPAFKLGENTKDPLAMYMGDLMTVPASLAGIPALSVPAGTTASQLPIGVQLMANTKNDSLLLALAKQMEDN